MRYPRFVLFMLFCLAASSATVLMAQGTMEEAEAHREQILRRSREPLPAVRKDLVSMRSLARDLDKLQNARAFTTLVVYEGSQQDMESVAESASLPTDGFDNSVVLRLRPIEYQREVVMDTRGTSSTMELLKSQSEFICIDTMQCVYLVERELSSDESWVMNRPISGVIKSNTVQLTMAEAAELMIAELGMMPDSLGIAAETGASTIVWTEKSDGRELKVRELLARMLTVVSGFEPRSCAFQVLPVHHPWDPNVQWTILIL